MQGNNKNEITYTVKETGTNEEEEGEADECADDECTGTGSAGAIQQRVSGGGSYCIN